MGRIALSLGLALALASPAPAPPVPKADKFSVISLKDHANLGLDEPINKNNPTNTLKDFPQGNQKYGEVPFEVGKKVMQLKSSKVPDYPDKIEGVPVDKLCAKLHILHATGWGGIGNKNSGGFVEDGTEIGRYVVHYADKTEEKIPIIYGKDVRDWFFIVDEQEPERAKVAWKGETEFSKTVQAKVRVYHTTWTNPNPDKKIRAIDFVGVGDKTPCAPFCLGLTAESK